MLSSLGGSSSKGESTTADEEEVFEQMKRDEFWNNKNCWEKLITKVVRVELKHRAEMAYEDFDNDTALYTPQEGIPMTHSL